MSSANQKRKGGKPKKLVSSAQTLFIEKVKENALNLQRAGKPAPFRHQPSQILYGGSEKKLDVTKWYCHDVLLCAPHLNYPKVMIPCKCGGVYKPTQWNNDRLIFDIHGPVTLLQYRYECDACHTSKTTGELVKLEECPDIVRFNTQRQYFMTHGNIAFTHIFLA